MRRGRAGWGAAIVAAAALAATPAFGQSTERVSVAATGTQAQGGRYTPRPSVSADGNTVAFESPVATLVAGDANSASDIFIASGGAVARVLGNGSVEPNCTSQRASVSADGQRVAFDSCASNLVAGDTNNVSDVFVLDRGTGTVTRVSVSTASAQGLGPSFSAAISPNGQFVAFLSQAPNLATGSTANTHVYLRDLDTNTTYLVSRASGVSGTVATSEVRPSVANDGTVAFASTASNLVSGDTNSASDVFLRRGATTGSPTTVRVSLSATGAQLTSGSTRPTISADAQLVAFETAAAAAPGDGNGLTDVFVRDIAGSTTHLASRGPGGTSGNGNSFEASISASGTFIVFTSQSTEFGGTFDAALDIFRAEINRTASPVAVGPVVRITTGPATPTGDAASADVSDAGRVVFSSDDTGLTADDLNGDTDVFASTGAAVERLTRPAAGLGESYSGQSLRPAPSYDGTIVAFLSSATNLVSDDVNGRVDVFVRNRTTNITERLPLPAGYESFDADWVTISHDGRFIAYTRGSLASGTGGAFLYDRFSGTSTPVSVASPGTPIQPASQPRISASGRYVAYLTSAQLDAADTNGFVDVYLFDRLTGSSALVSRGTAGASNFSSTSPAVSADGRVVVFASGANNLVAGDTNARVDIFARDMVAGTTVRLSTNVDVQPATIEARDPFISADGRYVAYLLSSTVLTSEATAASDVFVARTDGSTLPRGPLNGLAENTGTVQGSYDPTLSMFGRYLSYRSYAPDLVVGDTNDAADVFARQVLGPGVQAPSYPANLFGTLQRVSVSGGGAEAAGGTGFDTENPEINGNGTAAVFQSGFTNLVADDTNFMVDTFIRSGIFPGECTFLDATLPGYTAFAGQYGLDPCANSGSPYADPDGDGATNEEEHQAGTNPILGAFTRYFAEGATKTAALDFDVRLALANPSPAPVEVEITYQLPSGVAVPATQLTLQPWQRQTVLLDQQPGIAENGPDTSYEFSTTVKATAPIGVDRLMTWDKTSYAGHAETGVVSPSRTWYFAEGATIAGFNLFYLLQNPNPTPVTVEGRYLLGTGAVHTKTYTLQPNSRFNVWANVETIGGATPLAAAEFSAAFTVTVGEPIIAERAMYRGANPLFKAGHESAGINAPANEWFLAEGNAGDFFDHFVLIGNTTNAAALVQADFIVGGSSTIGAGVYTKQYTVLPNSRFNIWVDEQEIGAGQFPFRTGSSDVSVRIRSLNGVPLIVERAMWWPGNSTTWYEAHNSPGTARTAPRWVLAEGENGGQLGWQTYILIANVGDVAGQYRPRLLLEGQTVELAPRTVQANSRQTITLAELLAEAGVPADSKAGVLIESVGSALPLVVERAMYSGAGLQLGTNALGTPLP